MHVPKTHREPEARDTIQDTEVHHLRPAPELRCHALGPNVEDLRSGASVDVLTPLEGLDQGRLPGHVRENPELYLRVVGDEEPAARRSGEGVPNTGAHLGADGDVLQVRRVAGETSRGRRGLVESAVDAASLADETDYVGALQFGELAVGDDAVRNRMLNGELLQYLGVRRVAGLGLPYGRKAHLLEEDLA